MRGCRAGNLPKPLERVKRGGRRRPRWGTWTSRPAAESATRSLSKVIAPGSKSSTTGRAAELEKALFLAALTRPRRVRLDDAGDVDSTDLDVGNPAESGRRQLADGASVAGGKCRVRGRGAMGLTEW